MSKILTFFIACFLVLQLSAKSTSKDEEVDFSILERSTELSRYLDSKQRVQLIKLEESVQAALEKIRSGEYMKARKPSSLNPNEDLKPFHAKGEQLVEEGELEARTQRLRIVQLLRTAETQKEAQAKARAARYNFRIEEMDFTAALKQSAEKVMADAWAKGYDHVLFDGVRIVEAGKSRISDVETRNMAYDILVGIDGTRFTLTMPIDLSYSTTTEPAPRFVYENEAAFVDSKGALLAIEKIETPNQSSGILAVRAIDLQKFTLISSELITLAPDESAPSDTTGTPLPTSGMIEDGAGILDTLGALKTPYQFGWDLTQLEDPERALAYSLLLQQTIQQNAGIQLLETQFVERSYLQANETLAQHANAVFQLDPRDGNEAVFTLSSRLISNNRQVVIGQVSFGSDAVN